MRGIEQLGAVPQRQERLLDDRFGDAVIPAEPQRHREDRLDVAILESAKGGLRPIDHLLDEERVRCPVTR